MPRTNRYRNPTRLAFAVFALALLAVGARAAEPADTKADDLRAIRDLLTRIEQRMANQQATNDVLMDIVRKDLKDLRDEVSHLQRDLADVRNRANAAPTTSISGYRGNTSASLSVTPAAPMATIRLVNTHFVPMTAVVNGVTYTVPPGQQQPVTVPAGAVNYQVFGVNDSIQTRTLVPNQTLTLTYFPT
jgi:hypothetical protein